MTADAAHFLVTAGPTREAIDRVRDWGNVFSGNTGYAIATALAEVGRVTLITSNADHLAALARPLAIRHAVVGVGYRSYDDLRAALESAMAAHRFDGVYMTAAVSDYTPAGAFEVLERRPRNGSAGEEVWIVRSAQAGKVKSSFEQMAVLGTRTEKLVDLFRSRWAFKGLLVKFKLEVGVDAERLMQIGQASRAASGADFLVANTLDMVTGPDAGAYVLSAGAAVRVARADLPAAMVKLASDHLGRALPRD